jgi:hypothetical protein
VFNPQTATVVLGNIPGAKNTPVSNFALHEFGHGLDALRKKVSLLSQEDRFTTLHQEFKKLARAAGHLNNYYVQNGTLGAGASEFFADGFRAWAKAQREPDPELRNAIVRNSFAEAGTFVPTNTAQKILAYYDSITAKNAKPEPKPIPARAPRKSAASEARGISFDRENQIRALRRSGQTYKEISDYLGISVGAISYLLGKENNA